MDSVKGTRSKAVRAWINTVLFALLVVSVWRLADGLAYAADQLYDIATALGA